MVTDAILCFHNLLSVPDQSNITVPEISSVTFKKEGILMTPHTQHIHTYCILTAI